MIGEIQFFVNEPFSNIYLFKRKSAEYVNRN
jgi:hypothetical protein